MAWKAVKTLGKSIHFKRQNPTSPAPVQLEMPATFGVLNRRKRRQEFF